MLFLDCVYWIQVYYTLHVNYRWFKHLSDATEAYKGKEGKSKNSDHTHDAEEETVQELPTSSREATERAETIGGSDVATGGEAETSPRTDSNQNSDTCEEDKNKSLSHTESDGSLSAGK